jgi:hypothetical protein
VTTFFHAWRRNQANRQAAAWLEERTEARSRWPRSRRRSGTTSARLVDTLLDGTDGEVEPALNELWDVLADRPDLRERFARLRIIADALDFVKLS